MTKCKCKSKLLPLVPHSYQRGSVKHFVSHPSLQTRHLHTHATTEIMIGFAYAICIPDFKDEVMPISKVSRFVEDATFGYQDFARRGEDNPPTFRAQVCHIPSLSRSHSSATLVLEGRSPACFPCSSTPDSMYGHYQASTELDNNPFI